MGKYNRGFTIQVHVVSIVCTKDQGDLKDQIQTFLSYAHSLPQYIRIESIHVGV